jgi:hypothetical protein
VDLRAENVIFSGEEMAQLIQAIVLPVLQGKDWKSALLVERPR